MTFPIWYFLFDKEVIHSKWNISSRNILSNSAHEWKYCHKVWIYSLFIETSLYFVSWLERGLLNPGFHMIALIFPIASDMETIWWSRSSPRPNLHWLSSSWLFGNYLEYSGPFGRSSKKVMLSCLKGVHTVIIACLMVIVTGQVLLAGRFLFLFLFLFVSHVMLQISRNRKWRKRDSRTKCSITPCLIISTVPW